MSKQLFEYAKNRFVNPTKIISMSIYSKQAETPNERGEYTVIYRVAIDLDVKEAPKSTVYSDAYETEELAKQFLLSIPVD